VPIPGLPAWTILYGLALSPDGSELAVMFEPNAAPHCGDSYGAAAS